MLLCDRVLAVVNREIVATAIASELVCASTLAVRLVLMCCYHEFFVREFSGIARVTPR